MRTEAPGSGKTPSVSVVIPTLNPGKDFEVLIDRLQQQTYPPHEIIVVDSSSEDRTAEIARRSGCVIHMIRRSEFKHGATRNLGASLASGDIFVFMTQDALPADASFLETLVDPISQGAAAAAMARQIPSLGATPLEKYARYWNYPAESQMRTLENAFADGGMGFFFSNAAAAVDAKVFRELGGFPEGFIVNEDMLICRQLLSDGFTAAYCANARVYHSHRYGLRELFQRYFDIGVSFRQAENLLDRDTLGQPGRRFALGQMAYLAREGHLHWLPASVLVSGIKLAGFQTGLAYRRLPMCLCRSLSRQKGYWG